MSEPTKVKESAHTPGPWHVVSGNLIQRTNGQVIARAENDTWHTDDEVEANARRIVACVNYCEGVSTPEIEAAPASTNLQAILRMIDGDLPRFTAERDRLRERVAELTEALKRFANLDNNVPSGTWAVDASYCERARAVLAKASE